MSRMQRWTFATLVIVAAIAAVPSHASDAPLSGQSIAVPDGARTNSISGISMASPRVAFADALLGNITPGRIGDGRGAPNALLYGSP